VIFATRACLGHMMIKTFTLAAAVAALAVPAAAQAGAPSPTDKQNAAQECRTERGTTAATREAFAQKYGTNKNKKNAFGKCVSRKAADEQREHEAAKTGAQKACTAEQGTTAESQAAFEAKYGTNKNKKNAFGKCVSQQAKLLEDKADAADQAAAAARRNAAEQCDDERGETAASREAFTNKYGTNANKSNAFGKCVSQAAKAGA
jgi:hypothetical protein